MGRARIGKRTQADSTRHKLIYSKLVRSGWGDDSDRSGHEGLYRVQSPSVFDRKDRNSDTCHLLISLTSACHGITQRMSTFFSRNQRSHSHSEDCRRIQKICPRQHFNPGSSVSTTRSPHHSINSISIEK